MSIAHVNGQRIYYEDSGGDGPPVPFLHGFLMDRRMFDPQVDALAEAFRCVRFDARAFGDTEWDGEPFRLDEIEQPALVIHGEADEGIPLACGEELARALPACEDLVVVPDAWHTPNLTRPDLVNPPLRAFLERHAG